MKALRLLRPLQTIGLDVADFKLKEFTRLCEKYIPDGKVKSYARGLLGLTRWVKKIVVPKHMESFDYTKDQAYKTATGE